MAKKPVIINIADISREQEPRCPGVDDSGSILRPEGINRYDDGRPNIGIMASKELLKSPIRKSAVRNVRNYMLEISGYPDRARPIVDDFLFDDSGIKLVGKDGAMGLCMVNDIATANDGTVSVIFLPHSVVDQFCGLISSGLDTAVMEHGDMVQVCVLAFQGLLEGVYAAALHRHLIEGNWSGRHMQPADYIRRMRIVKHMVGQNIGMDELKIEEPDMMFDQIAATYSYVRTLKLLEDTNSIDELCFQRLEEQRAELSLMAYRATEEPFFVGTASLLGRKELEAYLKAALDSVIPRSR